MLKYSPNHKGWNGLLEITESKPCPSRLASRHVLSICKDQTAQCLWAACCGAVIVLLVNIYPPLHPVPCWGPPFMLHLAQEKKLLVHAYPM